MGERERTQEYGNEIHCHVYTFAKFHIYNNFIINIRVLRRAINLLRDSFSPIFQYFSCYNNHVHVTGLAGIYMVCAPAVRLGFSQPWIPFRQPGKRKFAKEDKGSRPSCS